MQNQKNILIINAEAIKAEGLIKELDKSAWRVFSIGESSKDDPLYWKFDGENAAELSNKIVEKTKEMRVKIDAVVGFSPVGLHNVRM